MEWNRVLIPLLLWTITNHISNIALYLSDASAGSRTSSSALKTWFKLLSEWIPKPTVINHNNLPSSSLIESSFTPEEELILQSNSFHLRQSTDGCTCSSSGSCSVTCTSLESRCGRICTITTEFFAFDKTYYIPHTDSYYTTVTYAYHTKTLSTKSYFSYSTGCEEAIAECTATSEASTAATAAVAYETHEPDTYTTYSPPDSPHFTSSTLSTTSNFEYSTDCEQVTEGCITSAVAGTEAAAAVTIEPYETEIYSYHSTAVNTYYPLSSSSTPNDYGYTGCEQGTEGCTTTAVEIAEAVVAAITDIYSSSNTAVDTYYNNPSTTTTSSTGSSSIIAGYTLTALAALAVIVAAVTAVAIAVGVALPAVEPIFNQTGEIQEELEEFISNGELFDTLTPVNDLPIPVPGKDLPDDGCGSTSIRFQDGRCYPLLKRGPCRNPYYWVTVHPVSLTGQCRPRLCGKGQVFVGTDGLCHDSEEPFACRGGRKLFYTAYGDPICDCPIGQYPFPGVLDDCVSLFTRGPCPLGEVATITQTQNIACSPSQCLLNAPNLPLARYSNGLCYALGSQGPCQSQSIQLFGYNVFRGLSLCVNVTALDSPYFLSELEENLLDSIFNRVSPDYNDFRVFLVYDPQNTGSKRFLNATSIQRQGESTAGIFQLPARLPDPQLNPCRPGAKNGNNFKCIDSLVSLEKKQNILQAVQSAFECPDDSILQAKGQCRNDAQGANCGPSYQFIESIGQCRAVV